MFELFRVPSTFSVASEVLPLRFGKASPTKVLTHRPLSSSFWGLPYRILNINHKKELQGAYGQDPFGRVGPRFRTGIGEEQILIPSCKTKFSI